MKLLTTSILASLCVGLVACGDSSTSVPNGGGGGGGGAVITPDPNWNINSGTNGGIYQIQQNVVIGVYTLNSGVIDPSAFYAFSLSIANYYSTCNMSNGPNWLYSPNGVNNSYYTPSSYPIWMTYNYNCLWSNANLGAQFNYLQSIIVYDLNGQPVGSMYTLMIGWYVAIQNYVSTYWATWYPSYANTYAFVPYVPASNYIDVNFGFGSNGSYLDIGAVFHSSH